MMGGSYSTCWGVVAWGRFGLVAERAVFMNRRVGGSQLQSIWWWVFALRHVYRKGGGANRRVFQDSITSDQPLT